MDGAMGGEEEDQGRVSFDFDKALRSLRARRSLVGAHTPTPAAEDRARTCESWWELEKRVGCQQTVVSGLQWR